MKKTKGMKRVLSILLTMALLLSTVAIAGVSAATPDTVAEGDCSFESYETGVDLALNDSSYNFAKVSDAIAGKTGSKTVMFSSNEASGNARPQMLVKDDNGSQIVIEEGVGYEISFYIFIPNDAPSYKVNYWFAAADNEDMFSSSNKKDDHVIAETSGMTQPTKGVWTQITATVDAAAHGGKLRLGISGATSTRHTFYIDDISVKKIGPDTVADGDCSFESYETGVDLALNDSSYNFAKVSDAIAGKTGSKTVMFSSNEASGNGRPQMLIKDDNGSQIVIEEGVGYEISFYIFIPNDAPSYKINYWFAAADNEDMFSSSNKKDDHVIAETSGMEQPAKGVWTQITATVDAAAHGGKLRLGISGATSTRHTFYIDDISVKKVVATTVPEGDCSFESYATGDELSINRGTYNYAKVSDAIAGKTGNKSVMFSSNEASGNGRPQMLIKDDNGSQIVIEEGVAYEITFYIFIPNDAPSYEVNYWFAAADNEDMFSSSNKKDDYVIAEKSGMEQPTKGEWKAITTTINAAAHGGKLRLGISGWTSTRHTFYIDDISVKKLALLEANEGVLTFENYELDKELDLNARESTKIVVSDAIAGKSGSKVGLVTSNEPSGNTRPQMLVKTDAGEQLRIYKGRSYEFKFNVYIPDGWGSFGLNYWIAAAENTEMFDSTNPKNNYVLAEVNSDLRFEVGQWTELTLKVQDAQCGGMLRFGITGYSSTAHSFYIDDLSLTMIDPPAAMDEAQSFEDYSVGDKLSVNTDAAVIAASNEDVHTGMMAAKIVTTGNAVDSVPQMAMLDYELEPMTVKQGGKYDLSFYVMIPFDTNYDLQFWIAAVDNDTPFSATNPRTNVVLDTTVVTATNRGGWQLVTLTIKDCAYTGALRMGISGTTAESHTFYIDDMKIRERSSLPIDMEAMNFENYETGENIHLYTYNSCVVTVVDEQSYTGDKSARIESHDRTGNYRSQFNLTDANGNLLKLEKGEACYVSLMMLIPEVPVGTNYVDYWLAVVPEDKADTAFNNSFKKNDHVLFEYTIDDTVLEDYQDWVKVKIPVNNCPADGVLRLGITHDNSDMSIATYVYVDDIKKEPPQYVTVKFDTNGSKDEMDDVVVLSGSRIPYKGDPYLDGSDFMGWYTGKEFRKDQYFDINADSVDGEDGTVITLYARWRKWGEAAVDFVDRGEEEQFEVQYYDEKVWVDGQASTESPYADSQRPEHNDAAPIVVTPDDVTPEPDGGMPPWIIVVIIVAAVAVVGGGAVIAAILLKKKKA